MNNQRILIFALSSSLLAAVLVGCKTPVVPVSNGYVEKQHKIHDFNLLSDPIPPRVSFEFQDDHGKTTLIWPSLYGVKEVVKDNLAIFVGDTAFVDDGDKSTRPRLFAVKYPAPPLDITEEVLWLWSKANGKNFSVALSRFGLVIPKQEDDKLKLHFEFTAPGYLSVDKDWPDTGELELDWKQVEEITQAISRKGVLEKDLMWRTPYIGEPF